APPTDMTKLLLKAQKHINAEDAMGAKKIKLKETSSMENKRSKEDDQRFASKSSDKTEQYRPKLVDQHLQRNQSNQYLQHTPLNASLEQGCFPPSKEI
ncbi:hypothetical protein U1Q18_025564, partial [Sarracenia purpurea var. burkii]